MIKVIITIIISNTRDYYLLASDNPLFITTVANYNRDNPLIGYLND